MVKLGRNHPLVKYVTKQNRCATCISQTNNVPVPPIPPVPPVPPIPPVPPGPCPEKIVEG